MDATKDDVSRITFRSSQLNKVFKNISSYEYNGNKQEKIIESIMRSGLARIYFIAGRDKEHIDRLSNALDAFPDNSFALVQAGHLLVKWAKTSNEEEEREEAESRKKLFNLIQGAHSAVKVRASNKDYLSAAEKLFERVLDLIDIKGEDQFYTFQLFKYRIKFEALLGLAYIDFIKGLDFYAEHKYNSAEDTIKEIDKFDKNNKFASYKAYLNSILSLNKGRNLLEYDIKRRDSNPKNHFDFVLRIYEEAEQQSKDELAEIAALAHNNLGVYYINEGLDEEAEKEFKQAIDLNPTSHHARYNLGVLYNRRDEKARAKTLIQNAYNLDPKFVEAKEALKRLGAVEGKKNLGIEWLEWWFEKPKKITH